MRKGISMEDNRKKWQKELQDFCRKCPKNGNCGNCAAYRDEERKRLLAIKKNK